jgi:hypothetical protein
MKFTERAKTTPLGNVYDGFEWAAINLIVVVAVISWMADNWGAAKGDASA